MRKIAKIVLIILLVLTMFPFSSCAIFISDADIFNNTKYSTVEELHAAYQAGYEQFPGACRPCDIVTYFSKESEVFVICTYAHCANSGIYQEKLIAYIVKKDQEGFYLECTRGIANINQAIFDLKNDYEDILNDLYYAEYRTRSQNNCYAFVYKSKSEPIDLYFDGVKMDETICINPFTQEEFILCYATSNKTYSILECLFVPMEKRHTLEVKQQEY